MIICNNAVPLPNDSSMKTLLKRTEFQKNRKKPRPLNMFHCEIVENAQAACLLGRCDVEAEILH